MPDLSTRPLDDLIKDLQSSDAATREAAVKELQRRVCKEAQDAPTGVRPAKEALSLALSLVRELLAGEGDDAATTEKDRAYERLLSSILDIKCCGFTISILDATPNYRDDWKDETPLRFGPSEKKTGKTPDYKLRTGKTQKLGPKGFQAYNSAQEGLTALCDERVSVDLFVEIVDLVKGTVTITFTCDEDPFNDPFKDEGTVSIGIPAPFSLVTPPPVKPYSAVFTYKIECKCFAP